MTKKITVSLPDDIAERLEQEKNVSAYVADSIRRRMNGELTRDVLREAGFDITEESIAEARRQRTALLTAMSPEARDEARRISREIAETRARYRR